MSDIESDEVCTCDDPMNANMKLYKCGSALCRAIKDKIPLLFNGHAFFVMDEGLQEYTRIPVRVVKEEN